MDGSQMTILVDTREQRPYEYPGAVTRTLRSGDYSIEGMEHLVAVERKTKPDAYSSLGRWRDRFERECSRLSGYQYAAIVVESTLPDFLLPQPFSKVYPQSAMCSLLSWSVKYGLPVFFAGDRSHGQAVTFHLLRMFHKQYGKVVESDH